MTLANHLVVLKVVMAVTDEVELARLRDAPCWLGVVDERDLARINSQFHIDAVERHVAVIGRKRVKQTPIAVVIAKDDVNGTSKGFSKLVDDKGRAQVTTMEEYVRTTGLHLRQRTLQHPDVIVAVRKNGDFCHIDSRFRVVSLSGRYPTL